jgi:hypothetical protein
LFLNDLLAPLGNPFEWLEKQSTNELQHIFNYLAHLTSTWKWISVLNLVWPWPSWTTLRIKARSCSYQWPPSWRWPWRVVFEPWELWL